MINERMLEKINEYINDEYVKVLTVDELVEKINVIGDKLFTISYRNSFVKSMATIYCDGIIVSVYNDKITKKEVLLIESDNEEIPNISIFTEHIKEIEEDQWSCYFKIISKNDDKIVITYDC